MNELDRTNWTLIQKVMEELRFFLQFVLSSTPVYKGEHMTFDSLNLRKRPLHAGYWGFSFVYWAALSILLGISYGDQTIAFAGYYSFSWDTAAAVWVMLLSGYLVISTWLVTLVAYLVSSYHNHGEALPGDITEIERIAPTMDLR